MYQDIEIKNQNHSELCWIHQIPFESRTLNSCSCKEKDNYKKNFHKNRDQTVCENCNRQKKVPGEGGYTDKNDWYCCNNCLKSLIEKGFANDHSHYL